MISNDDLHGFISANPTHGVAGPLTLDIFIENVLHMMWGPRDHDENYAFKSLGGNGFAAHRKRRRLKVWGRAVAIAERVGHGDVAEPLFVSLDRILVPLSVAENARWLFNGPEEK